MILKAMKTEAEWCVMDDDRSERQIGYALARMARRIEEIRAGGGACTP